MPDLTKTVIRGLRNKLQDIIKEKKEIENK